MIKLFRAGAEILFVLAVIVFVAVFAYQIFMLADLQRQSATGVAQGALRPTWAFIVAAIASALSAAAAPFFGACVIDRADQLIDLRSKGVGK